MNINKTILTGRLTRDPELRALPNDNSVCELRLAVNGMGRKGEVGFINVTVYGAPGEACAKYLSKGSKVAADGRIEYHEWETDDGSRRHEHRIVADRVEFLTPRSQDADQEAQESEPVAA